VNSSLAITDNISLITNHQFEERRLAPHQRRDFVLHSRRFGFCGDV